MTSKIADARYPILPVLKERWSPRAFTDRAIAPEELMALFEAARWAASANNLQPWRFVYAAQGEPGFETILACLKDTNQIWCRRAAVLMIAVAKTIRDDGRIAGHAVHDLGQALAMLSVEATARGIGVHQMAGFFPDKARELLAIPDGYQPTTAVALGYPGEIERLPENLQIRERAPRERRPVEAFAFRGAWLEG